MAEGKGDHGRVERVEEWAGHAVTLVKGPRLISEEEVDSRLDEGGSWEGVEEVEINEGVAVVFGGVRPVGEVYEVIADAEAGD